ncbi:MAG TPA: hypothetical protein VMQ93_19000 [Novosphingobium sp.]|nr:hypothetical protein [Novosphingobium sp.]
MDTVADQATAVKDAPASRVAGLTRERVRAIAEDISLTEPCAINFLDNKSRIAGLDFDEPVAKVARKNGVVRHRFAPRRFGGST